MITAAYRVATSLRSAPGGISEMQGLPVDAMRQKMGPINGTDCWWGFACGGLGTQAIDNCGWDEVVCGHGINECT
jgi:hypothetical protein